jgi:hypothetical protein
MKKIFFLILLITLASGFSFCSVAQAYQIQDLPGTTVEGDIVLGPTKIELFLEPGEKTTREIMVTNRTGRTIDFAVGIEDFRGSRDPEQTVILMGDEKGPYSLRDWIKPEIEEFTLEHGQRIHLPVEISIPSDTEPGGHYGVVFALAKPSIPAAEAEKETAEGQIAIISRVGALFFVRIAGEVNEDGFLKDFKASKNYYESGPVPFELFFENNGSVHLTPYGVIEIFNLLGKKVDEIEIDPWFALPDSLRLREIKWEKGFLLGKYTAVASVNRGYEDIIDQKAIEFWAIPWKIILAGLVGLFLIILFFRWIISKFEIRRKSQPNI